MSDDFCTDRIVPVLERGQLQSVYDRLAWISAEPGRGLVSLDIETTGLNEWAPHARIVTMSLTMVDLDADWELRSEPTHYVIGLSHPDAPMHTCWREALREVALKLRDFRCRLIGQNVRFDLRWIYALTGVELHDHIVGDTGLTSHLMDENTSAGLKPRVMSTFGIEKWNDFDFRVIDRETRAEEKKTGRPAKYLGAERVPYYDLAIYNARDTYWTWRLLQRHADQLGLGCTSELEMLQEGGRDDHLALRLGQYAQLVGTPSVRTITDMEQTGFLLDKDWCENKLAELAADLIEALEGLAEILRQALAELHGELDADLLEALDAPVSYAPTAGYFAVWADVMVRTGRLQILAATPQGRPSWSKEVLKALAFNGLPAAALLLTYRRAEKQTQFLNAWLRLAQTDGRIHATYHYFRVVTGRLSASDPNMQQVAKELRPAFIAPPGKLLVEADFSQIELRVAAHIAKCEPMIEAYQVGADLHTLMAAQINDIDPSAVTSIQRQQAKAANFGFLYGMGAHKFVSYAFDSYQVRFTHEEAESARLAFFATWKGLSEWHDRTARRLDQEGFVVTPLGRLRRLPDIWSADDYLRGAAVRQAYNAPVQSMASDLMTIAAGKIRRLPGIRPVALVHDSIVAEVPKDRGILMARAIKHTMENLDAELLALGVRLAVPLVADVSIGRAWGAGSKIL